MEALATVLLATSPSRVHVRGFRQSIFLEQHPRLRAELDLQHVSIESPEFHCISTNIVGFLASRSSGAIASSNPINSPTSIPQRHTSTSSSTASAITATSTPTATSDSKSKNTNLGAAVGAPVAVVSVAFIALLLWFLRYWHRTNAKLKDLQEQVTMRESWTEKPPPLQQSNPHELNALEQRPELGVHGAGARTHELPVGHAA